MALLSSGKTSSPANLHFAAKDISLKFKAENISAEKFTIA